VEFANNSKSRMVSPPAQVSVIAPIQPAIERARRLLFQPFDLARWFAIGFCAWLARLGGPHSDLELILLDARLGAAAADPGAGAGRGSWRRQPPWGTAGNGGRLLAGEAL
jgi:hypothetical protein